MQQPLDLLDWLDETILPILVGAMLLGTTLWALALVGSLLPVPELAYAKAPWFHDLGALIELAFLGAIAFVGTLLGVFSFLLITFSLGCWVLGRPKGKR